MRPVEMSPTDREEFMGRIQRAYEEKGLRPRFSAFNVFAQPQDGSPGSWGTIAAHSAPFSSGRTRAQSTRADVWEGCARLLGWNDGEVVAFVRGVDGTGDERSVSGLPELMAAFELGRMARRMLG